MGRLSESGVDYIWKFIKPSLLRSMTSEEFQALTDEEKSGTILVTDQPSYPAQMYLSDIYTEGEQRIGVWKDGKPRYRNLITGLMTGDTPDAAARLVDLTDLNIDTLIDLKGSTTSSANAKVVVPNYITASSAMGLYVQASGYLCERHLGTGFNSQPLSVILEYTKATDVPLLNSFIQPTFIDEYDTDNGWHVRKHSDGYIEMVKEVDNLTVPVSSWAEWGTGNSKVFRSDYIFSKEAMPLTLIKKYSESPTVTRSSAGFNFFWNIGTSGSLGYNNPYRFLTMVVPSSDVIISVSLTVTGRWK